MIFTVLFNKNKHRLKLIRWQISITKKVGFKYDYVGGKEWAYIGACSTRCPLVPELMHGGAPEAFLHQRKLQLNPYPANTESDLSLPPV